MARLGWTLAIAATLLAGSATAQTTSTAMQPQRQWESSWGAGQQIPEPRNALSDDDLTDATLRQVVHLSAGGPALRVRLSNAYGTQPLLIDDAHVARAEKPGGSGIVAGTDHPLTFSGATSVTIPAGAEMLSDPVDMAVQGGGDLAISLHLPKAPAQQTGHPGSRATSYVAKGDQVTAPSLPDAKTVEHWYQLSGVQVVATGAPHTVIALGDSITDGHATANDSNTRWTDDLARRMRADPSTSDIGLVNAGIGGNRMLFDGLGPNAVARFDRDVLARAHPSAVILLEGVNDLGTLTSAHPLTKSEHHDLVAAITNAYRNLAERAHAAGVRIIGGTITPFAGNDYYHPDAQVEADRTAINDFIRHSGVFDDVVDFDKAIRDPAHPDRMLPAYDSGDHLHPSPKGYQVMADAVPLSLLATDTDTRMHDAAGRTGSRMPGDAPAIAHLRR